MNLEAEDFLGSVAERLMKALREARPASVRQDFAPAGQHMRWELKDLARRLDEQPGAVEPCDDLAPAPHGSDPALSQDGRRMLAAIDGLPKEEREVFDLIRIQGLTMPEAAGVLGVSESTVKRSLAIFIVGKSAMMIPPGFGRVGSRRQAIRLGGCCSPACR